VSSLGWWTVMWAGYSVTLVTECDLIVWPVYSRRLLQSPEDTSRRVWSLSSEVECCWPSGLMFRGMLTVSLW